MPGDVHLDGRACGDPRQRRQREVDGAAPEPRPRGVSGDPFEPRGRDDVAEAAYIDDVVGRLEHHDELRLAELGKLGEQPRDRAERDRQLLAREEQKRDRNSGRQNGRCGTGGLRATGPAQPLGEFEHDRDAALHVAGAEAGDHAVSELRRQVALRRDGVDVAPEQEAGAGVAALGDHPLPVLVDDPPVRRQLGRHPGEDVRLGEARRGDVDELDGAGGEAVHRSATSGGIYSPPMSSEAERIAELWSRRDTLRVGDAEALGLVRAVVQRLDDGWPR